MKAIHWLSALMALFSFVQHLNAQLTLLPPGLEPGDQYRLMFTTSATTDALSPDIDFYDDFVQSLADDAPVVGTWGLDWQAFISVPSQKATDHTETTPEMPIKDPFDFPVDGIPLYRVDGERIVGSYFDFFFWGHDNSLDITELGTAPATSFAWTGTLNNGNGGFPAGYSGGITTQGRITAKSGSAIQAQQFRSTAQAHLYAISELITVPEPWFHFAALISLVFFLQWARGAKS